MSRRSGKRGVGVVGLGVAACAACCAGPILGFVAATGLFTVAGVATFGAAGLFVLVPAGVWWDHRRASPRPRGPTARSKEPHRVDDDLRSSRISSSSEDLRRSP